MPSRSVAIDRFERHPLVIQDQHARLFDAKHANNCSSDLADLSSSNGVDDVALTSRDHENVITVGMFLDVVKSTQALPEIAHPRVTVNHRESNNESFRVAGMRRFGKGQGHRAGARQSWKYLEGDSLTHG